ncbi:ATP-grasp domain-containing protein [Ornithinimicrobium sp. Y1694]|uniref:ATP-grasp domain-containing protein n=1 Tax=Ornithinimicrobium sp. Y1694 TaxID=3418590 RepID=UPI003CEC9B3F
MASDVRNHLIGLLLGAEEDWPRAFESILRMVGPLEVDGKTHTLESERVRIHPFDLTDPVRHGLVIDRLAYWYYHPREWLKKAALMNDTYLLNSPFTFQAMEKHSAYVAMLRLGMKIPKTVLVPYKNPVDNVRWAYTSAHYNDPFDLEAIAEGVGYPLYMKPFDGGGWRGVSRVDDVDGLHRSYDDSGNMLMHLQATVDYDHFARALSIGPETMVMDFRPGEPMHSRYAVTHDFLSPQAGWEAETVSKVVNAFFGWEFNSCEMLVKGDDVHPIDYANACPDVAVTSLHYYFPWAITALVRWSAYCLATGRKAFIGVRSPRAYFDIADNEDMSYVEKMQAYRKLADDEFEADRYWDWTEKHLSHLPERVHEWVGSNDFDKLLIDTVKATYPEHEHEEFLAHFRGLTGLWVEDQSAQRASQG